MRLKFNILGHEIKICPENDVRLHVSEIPSFKVPDQEQWELTYPMDKRVDVFVQYKGFIEYVFREYDMALLNLGEPALIHLQGIFRSFREIRDKFESKGATPEQLKMFDDKVFGCFNKTVRVVESRTNELARVKSKELQYHVDVLVKLKGFNIEEYYGKL